MKTKMTPELLKELGWHKDKYKNWIYSDETATNSWIEKGTEGKFTLLQVVKFMIREEQMILKQDICKYIERF